MTGIEPHIQAGEKKFLSPIPSVHPSVWPFFGADTFGPGAPWAFLILARDAIEQLGADQVVFIPAAISPHKLGRAPSPAKARVEMLRAALAEEPRFSLDELEIEREGPSYSVETVEEIMRSHPDAHLIYLIGEDNVAALHTWHRINDLRSYVEFVVFGRGLHRAVHAFPTLTRRLDISATEIRERVARGASIRYLVPEPVRALIEQHRLYQPSSTRF